MPRIVNILRSDGTKFLSRGGMGASEEDSSFWEEIGGTGFPNRPKRGHVASFIVLRGTLSNFLVDFVPQTGKL
jgi:hypothetical protein